MPNHLYKCQPKVSIVELMSLSQLPNELVTEFLERFKRVRSRCNVQLLESEYAMATVNNMHPQLKERLIAIKYSKFA